MVKSNQLSIEVKVQIEILFKVHLKFSRYGEQYR